MNEKRLGRLEKKDLREFWGNEASDFTPWLAKEENLSQLGETVGLFLEPYSQEHSVGPFRADILCKEMRDETWVLIENQLDTSDHPHLGQLLTYAAGLEARTLIWIARNFTEQHRAAIDWLNEATGEDINLFGLEMELWQIDDSKLAPKFNIVSQPNNWKKQTLQERDRTGLSKIQIKQHDFWKELAKQIESSNRVIRPYKPGPKNSLSFRFGEPGFHLYASTHTTKHVMFAGFAVNRGPDRGRYYALVHKKKEEIEQKTDGDFHWGEPWGFQVLGPLFDPGIPTNWPSMHEWIVAKLEEIYEAIVPVLREIDLEEFDPSDE